MLCTRNPVAYDDTVAVSLPERTPTYTPVANRLLIDAVRDTFTRATGQQVATEHYGLTGNDQRMFGVMRFAGAGAAHGLSVGFRNSYDRSVAVGIAVGAQVFVCDNMCFSASSFMVLRRHTSRILEDLDELLATAALAALGHYGRMAADIRGMQRTELGDSRAFELLGTALGTGVLSSTQVNAALRDWREPRHPEFADRTLWSWYNACNEALKSSPAEQMLGRHARLHALAQENVEDRGVVDHPDGLVPVGE